MEENGQLYQSAIRCCGFDDKVYTISLAVQESSKKGNEFSIVNGKDFLIILQSNAMKGLQCRQPDKSNSNKGILL